MAETLRLEGFDGTLSNRSITLCIAVQPFRRRASLMWRQGFRGGIRGDREVLHGRGNREGARPRGRAPLVSPAVAPHGGPGDRPQAGRDVRGWG